MSGAGWSRKPPTAQVLPSPQRSNCPPAILLRAIHNFPKVTVELRTLLHLRRAREESRASCGTEVRQQNVRICLPFVRQWQDPVPVIRPWWAVSAWNPDGIAIATTVAPAQMRRNWRVFVGPWKDSGAKAEIPAGLAGATGTTLVNLATSQLHLNQRPCNAYGSCRTKDHRSRCASQSPIIVNTSARIIIGGGSFA
jgi:hypothetical protein